MQEPSVSTFVMAYVANPLHELAVGEGYKKMLTVAPACVKIAQPSFEHPHELKLMSAKVLHPVPVQPEVLGLVVMQSVTFVLALTVRTNSNAIRRMVFMGPMALTSRGAEVRVLVRSVVCTVGAVGSGWARACAPLGVLGSE